MSTWSYVSAGQRRGPVSDEDLYRLFVNGEVKLTSLIWKQGMQGWQPAAQVEALAPMLALLPPEIPPEEPPEIPPEASASPPPKNSPVQPDSTTYGPDTKLASDTWLRVRRHLGSSIALALGCLVLFAGLGLFSDPNKYKEGFNLLKLGGVMTLGALAYRSAKQRKFGEVKFAGMRVVLEIAALGVICIIILAQSRLKYEIATEPTTNLVAPLWAIVAYLVAILAPGRPTAETASPKPQETLERPTARTAAPKREEKQRVEKALEEDRDSYEAWRQSNAKTVDNIFPIAYLFILLVTLGILAGGISHFLNKDVSVVGPGPTPASTLGNVLSQDAPTDASPTASHPNASLSPCDPIFVGKQ